MRLIEKVEKKEVGINDGVRFK
ncbi:hypothetical protein BN185_160076 [Clostridioides difficile E28]|nr:hypothetical protein BN167_130053 [Clostridioides difficile E13]CCL05421.1 hypothetical protein BN168_130124 [Clostridioides difficile CD002]CCL60617.1 hypothetical protein BN182_160056 [Clostridioides difficile E9]CCL68716.1 hypothetical protein BN184_150082 [Clostridioides difficile T3]CCL72699.1 hypothetical protein BN185_160076 [Clostridioides difficile E28]